MSSAAKKLAEDIKQESVPTKTISYRIDVELSNVPDIRTTYMQVTGVPEDLPPEYENTVMHTAEAQFASALNQRMYLEFYTEGKTSKDEQPVFFNLTKIDSVQIKSITKIN